MSTATSRVVVVDGHRYLYAGRQPSIDGNGCDDQPADAAEPATDVVVPEAHFGTLCVVLSQPFRPRPAYALPPSVIAHGLPHKAARALAIEWNRDSQANGRRFWHFLVDSNCGRHGVLRVPVQPHEMPASADEYRDSDDVSCGVRRDALERVSALNKQIRAVAFTAKRWHVVIRSLKDEPAT